MTFLGLGVDVMQPSRIRSAVQRRGESFLRRIYTDREQEYCCRGKNCYERLAARWAGKEAVMKALGSGLSGFRWVDVQILPSQGGAPEVHLSGGAARRAERLGVVEVQLSLSHSKDVAIATAVLLGS